ncbi:amidohydrolase family protein [Candidatus Pacearchaeota archaeon]|nr:amidohydrolase family protein [Candidatus Pacearchaeota archaeon]
MIIDFHCHVGKLSEEEKLSFEELKKSMDRFNIDKSVVFVFSNDHETMVKESIEILDKSKTEDWIIPFLRIDPNFVKKEELNKLLDMDFKGLKLHPFMQKFVADDEKYFWIYEMCEKRNLPVLIHSSVKDKNYSEPMKIINIAKKFSRLNVVMAHFFGGDYNIIEESVKYPNLYVDTSVNSGSLRRYIVVKKYGFKNLILASDIPYDSQGVSIMKITEAGLNKDDEDKILSGNALKILNI